jgi:hypothetical protein
MKHKYLIIALAILIAACYVGSGSATIEWEHEKVLKLEAPPLAVAVDLSGRWIFVLTSEGKLNIFTPAGQFQDTITVGKHIDGIEVGPWENKLFLKSSVNNTVEILSLSFQQKINTVGSPSKGPAEAQVVMVVFDDFQ